MLPAPSSAQDVCNNAAEDGGLSEEELFMNIDLNCDMGENIGNDEEIMPYITSANIACGFHAGDAKTMQVTSNEWREIRVQLDTCTNAAEGARHLCRFNPQPPAVSIYSRAVWAENGEAA